MEITIEFARTDDCLDRMVPSDLRALVSERDQLRKDLADADKRYADLMRVSQQRLAEREAEKIELEAENDKLKDSINQLQNMIDKEGSWFAEYGKTRAVVIEREAEIAKLRGLLIRYRTETPAGHQPHMICHVVDEALSTPPSVTYLEQWERERYGEPVAWRKELEFEDGTKEWKFMPINILANGEPIYARKD